MLAPRARTRTLPTPAPSPPAPRRFLAKHNAIFFPKDVTLNYKKASSEYLRLWESAVGGGSAAGAGGGGGGGAAARAKQPWAITDPRKLLDLE